MAPLYLLPVGGEHGLEEVAIFSIYPTSARHPPPSEGTGEVPTPPSSLIHHPKPYILSNSFSVFLPNALNCEGVIPVMLLNWFDRYAVLE